MDSTPEQIPRPIWVLIASAFVIAIGFGFITPVLPQFATSFNVGAAAAGIVVSAFAFFRLVFAPTSGRLVTKFGERWVYLTGVLMVAASTAATAFAQTYWQLLLYRSVGGIGSTMFTISAVALLTRLAPSTIRARVTSAYASSFLVGGVAGPLLGSLLVPYGVEVPFLSYAALLVIAALVVGAFIPASLGDAASAAQSGPPITVRVALAAPAFRAALATGFANGWANFGFRFAIIPLFVAAVLTQDERAPGWALTVFAIGNVLGILITGRLSDKLGRKPFMVAGLLISGVATAATGWATSLAALFVLSVIAGGGAGAVNPAQQASMADLVGKGRNGAPVLAAYQMAQDLGAILGPVLAGTLVDLLGFEYAFVVTGLISIVAALVWSRTPDTWGAPPLPGGGSDSVGDGATLKRS
jgi:MFS family permease